MKALLLTNEYPPNVYGGAGVHVEFLSRELARLMDVEVRCFGDQHVDDGRLTVRGYPEPSGMTAPEYLQPVFGAMARGAAWAATDVDADVVHCHTWYTHWGGILIRQGYGIPLVRHGPLARAAAPLEARAACAAATTFRTGSSRRPSAWPTR